MQGYGICLDLINLSFVDSVYILEPHCFMDYSAILLRIQCAHSYVSEIQCILKLCTPFIDLEIISVQKDDETLVENDYT